MIQKRRILPGLAWLAQLLVLGVLLSSGQIARLNAQPTGTASKDELFHRIVASVQQGDFDNAIASSDVALRAAPNDYRIWTLRGMAYSGLRNPTSALASFEHALNIAPNYLPALEGAAQLKYQQGNERARPLLLRILAQLPSDPTTHAMLAVLDYKKRDCSGAITHFQQAGASISSKPDALADYGRCLATLKHFEEAIPVFEEALALDSTDHSSRYDLALCQLNAGQASNALTTLQPLLETDQSDERVSLLGADIYESAGDTEHAIDLLRNAILKNPKNPDAYLQFADLTYDHGSPKIGIDFLNAGLTQLPGEGRLYLVRGILLCQLGEFTKAFDDFQAANRLDPRLSYVDVAMGIEESQVHKSSEALARFRAAAKEHPDQAFTQYLLAEALSQQETPNAAEEIEAANRAVRLDPKLVAAQDLLAGIYLQQGRKQLAIDHSEAALAVDPNDQQALYHLVLALRETDRKGEIPALMKRMDELRHAERAEDAPKKKLHQLYEVQESK